MYITPAYAQAGGAGGGGDMLVSLLPIVLIFVVFYFLLIRPQQKKVKQHKAMVEALRRGDRVVTSGGILGTVTKVVNDGEIEVEIAQGTRVRILRQSVTEVLSKSEPASRVKSRSKADDEEEEYDDEKEDNQSDSVTDDSRKRK